MLQLAIGLALFAYLFHKGGASSIAATADLRVPPLVGAFVCTAGIAAIVGLRWATLLEALAGRRTSDWRSCSQYFLWTRVLGMVIPKDLSDLGGRTTALMAGGQVSLRHAAASVLLDRGFDLAIVILFLGPSLLFLSGTASAGVSVTLMTLSATAFYTVLRLAHRSILRLAVRLYNGLARIVARLPLLRRWSPETVGGLELPVEAIGRAFAFSLIKFLLACLRLMSFSWALDAPVSPTVFLLGAPVGQLSLLLAFTPGGLGIYELGWYGVLTSMAVPDVHVSAFLVVQRVLTTLFVVVLALLVGTVRRSRARDDQRGLDGLHDAHLVVCGPGPRGRHRGLRRRGSRRRPQGIRAGTGGRTVAGTGKQRAELLLLSHPIGRKDTMTDPGPEPRCLVCDRTQDATPLIPLQYRSGRTWICPQHLPILIHDPTQLVGRLPGAEDLRPAEHHD